MPDLAEVLDRTDLLELAGEGSYFRGVGSLIALIDHRIG